MTHRENLIGALIEGIAAKLYNIIRNLSRKSYEIWNF